MDPDETIIINNTAITTTATELNTIDCSWSFNTADEIVQLYNEDVYQELTGILAGQIALDLDNEILESISKEYDKCYCDIYNRDSLKKYRNIMENDYNFK